MPKAAFCYLGFKDPELSVQVIFFAASKHLRTREVRPWNAVHLQKNELHVELGGSDSLISRQYMFDMNEGNMKIK